MSIESKLAEWQAQGPECVVSQEERQFIADMRKASAAGVGYGWMQQVIEWEWQASDKFPQCAWGPEYYERRVAELEGRIATLEGKSH